MKGNYLVLIFLWLLSTNTLAQTSHTSRLAGLWINTQYDYFKDRPQYHDMLFKISPWFIKVDSAGKCTVTLLYEQRVDLGYPIDKKSRDGTWEYHYKKRCDAWLYPVEGNDSLMVYSNGNTPGAGIIFKKYHTAVRSL